MEKLQIYQIYKFKKGGSVFYMSEGDKVKVKTVEGIIYKGYLIGVSAFSEYFDIETKDGIISVRCEDVIDIIPE